MLMRTIEQSGAPRSRSIFTHLRLARPIRLVGRPAGLMSQLIMNRRRALASHRARAPLEAGRPVDWRASETKLSLRLKRSA